MSVWKYIKLAYWKSRNKGFIMSSRFFSTVCVTQWKAREEHNDYSATDSCTLTAPSLHLNRNNATALHAL